MAMPADAPTNSTIVADYRARTPGSAALFDRARTLFPSGITHDTRNLDPYPLYVQRGQGSRKWCVDGHEYVDYFGGHGALLLGESARAVLKGEQSITLRRQVSKPGKTGERTARGGREAMAELERRYAEWGFE